MICKICNATIDDNAAACPYCGSPVTASVDPGMSSPAFPDPASSAFQNTNPIPDPVPTPTSVPEQPAAPTADDLGLSAPAQPYSAPAEEPAPQQPASPYNSMDNNAGSNPYNQPNYGQPTPPPSFDPNQYSANYNNGGDDLEKRAGTVQTLGIVSLVVSIVIGFCCCAIAGPIVGIVGLVKYNGLKDSLSMLSPEGQKKANLGKILCIVAIVLGALAIGVNILLMANGGMDAFMEGFEEGLNS